jgi:general secretion pathway protein A
VTPVHQIRQPSAGANRHLRRTAHTDNKSTQLLHFGFREEPFGATPDPSCLYSSNTHREALASLKLAFFSNRGFTALIAPPGMGKTTLLFRFLEDIRQSARTVFLFDVDPQCQPRELIAYILRDLGIHPGSNSAKMHEQLNEVLVEEARAGRRFVVVIDEAQNLSEAALETVRLLTNFETPRAKLMQIVLSGQPQLADKLMSPSLEQLQQRISTFCRIEPLSKEETSTYILHRLVRAGCTNLSLFNHDALQLITEAAHGVPRNINTLCFNSLVLCRALKSKEVTRNMVAEIIADRQLQTSDQVTAASQPTIEEPAVVRGRERSITPMNRLIPVYIGLFVICLLIVLGVSKSTTTRSREPEAKMSTVSTPLPKPSIDSPTPISPARGAKDFRVTVEANQTLRNLAIQYLGSYNLDLLHQIQSLNPTLINPDHIVAGQMIWLPGSAVVPEAQSATSQR